MRKLTHTIDVRLTERMAALHGEFDAKSWFRLLLIIMEWSMHGLLWFLALITIVLFSNSKYASQTSFNLILATVFDMVDVGVLKLVFRRPRPPHNVDDMVVEAPYIDQFSFPSGHSSRAIMLAYIFHDIINDWLLLFNTSSSYTYFVLVVAFVYLYSLSMCASRILLGRHYISDVIGGILLGLIEDFHNLVYNPHRERIFTLFAGGCSEQVETSVSSMPMFGQIALGPPGSGKSTYCNGMKQLLEALGRRVIICNLDPANEYLPYETCDIDIRELVDAGDVSKNLNLGPNGSLIYCLEFLEHNLEWLINRLKYFRDEMNTSYVLFDFPGQIELFTHKNCLRNILERLRREAGLQLVTLNLVDIHYCTDAAKFIAVLLTSLNTMIRLETPHLNIISKMDLYEKFGDKMPFNLDYFVDVLDLKYILDCIDDDPFLKKFKEMNKLICDTIESYGLVSFMPLNIQDKNCMATILREADKANGFCFFELQERQLADLQAQECKATDDISV